jgi:hypothetical protein
MFRMYKKLARQLLIWVLYTRTLSGADGGRVRSHLYNNYYNLNPEPNDPQYSSIRMIKNLFDYEEPGDFEFKPSEMASEFFKLFPQNLNDDHDRDLIDAIANALQKSRGANIFSGKTLTQLRQAILTNDELIGLKSRLAQGDISCASCGGDIRSGDMLTLVKDMNNSNIVICSACRLPSQVTCVTKGCGNRVMLPSRTITALKKLRNDKCEKCSKPEEPEVIDAIEESVNVTSTPLGVRISSSPIEPMVMDQSDPGDEDDSDDMDEWYADEEYGSDDLMGAPVTPTTTPPYRAPYVNPGPTDPQSTWESIRRAVDRDMRIFDERAAQSRASVNQEYLRGNQWVSAEELSRAIQVPDLTPVRSNILEE